VPIVITPLGPSPNIGPGGFLQAETDFSGTLTANAIWDLQLNAAGSEVGTLYGVNFTSSSARNTFQIFGGQGNEAFAEQNVADGTHVTAVVTLNDPGNTTDSGTSAPIPWSNTENAWRLHPGQVSNGGNVLTPEQADQLANADAGATQSQQLLPAFLQAPVQGVNDFLAAVHDAVVMNLGTISNPIPIGLANWFLPVAKQFLSPRTLAGPNECNPVDVDISGAAYYSIGVTVDTYPPDWRFATPDNAWSYHDLAVITFVRGGTIAARHGVHTLTFTVSPVPDSITQTVTDLPVSIQPGDYHVRVEWAAGVCGTLTGYVLP